MYQFCAYVLEPHVLILDCANCSVCFKYVHFKSCVALCADDFEILVSCASCLSYF